jgi:DNA adenine methylase
LHFRRQVASNAGVLGKPDKTTRQVQLIHSDKPPTAEHPMGKPGIEVPFSRPFLKWAGGKTQLLPELAKYYPTSSVNRYFEPFLGSGAVFFHFKVMVNPKSSFLWDNNLELIQTFQAVRDDVEGVIEVLREHESVHSKEYFLKIRKIRVKKETKSSAIAARLIYLNKTCFNGLYRVNSRGEFNVPIGNYTKPSILNEEGLRKASKQLAGADIAEKDFRMVLCDAEAGDFVYLDPPYHPRSETAYFTSYTRDSFGEKDQRELAEVYRALDKKGCLLVLSNSDTTLVRQLYKDFRKVAVSARRNINSRADRRGPIKERLVVNNRLLEACRGRG